MKLLSQTFCKVYFLLEVFLKCIFFSGFFFLWSVLVVKEINLYHCFDVGIFFTVILLSSPFCKLLSNNFKRDNDKLHFTHSNSCFSSARLSCDQNCSSCNLAFLRKHKLILITSNYQRLQSVGDNDHRSKRFYSSPVLYISST